LRECRSEPAYRNRSTAVSPTQVPPRWLFVETVGWPELDLAVQRLCGQAQQGAVGCGRVSPAPPRWPIQCRSPTARADWLKRSAEEVSGEGSQLQSSVVTTADGRIAASGRRGCRRDDLRTPSARHLHLALGCGWVFRPAARRFSHIVVRRRGWARNVVADAMALAQAAACRYQPWPRRRHTARWSQTVWRLAGRPDIDQGEPRPSAVSGA